MVKGCRRRLVGVESGVAHDKWTKAELLGADYWGLHFYSSYTLEPISCGDPNTLNGPLILCRSCPIKQGFLW